MEVIQGSTEHQFTHTLTFPSTSLLSRPSTLSLFLKLISGDVGPLIQFLREMGFSTGKSLVLCIDLLLSFSKFVSICLFTLGVSKLLPEGSFKVFCTGKGSEPVIIFIYSLACKERNCV